MAVIVESQGKLGFPFYFPALRETGSRYADTKPRIYGIRDGAEQAPPGLPARRSTPAPTASTTASRG